MSTTSTPTGTSRVTRTTRAAFVVLLLGLCGALVGMNPAAAQGIGISPTAIEIREALRGGTSLENLTLSNSTASEVKLSLAVTGELASWITFSRADDPQHASITDVSIAAQSRAQVNIAVTVPAAAGNRLYQSTIEIVENPSTKFTGGGSGSAVGISAQLDVAVNVTGVERRASAVTDAFVDGAEVGQAQRFNAKVSNTGNVNVQTQVDVRIMKGTTVVADLSSKGENFPVNPGNEQLAYAEWKTDDALPGNYTAKFTVTDVAASPAKVIGTKDVDFRLDPKGTLTRSGSLADLKLINNPGKGEVAQFAAVFNNDGKVDSTAVLEGELYHGDKLVKSIVTPERLVKQGTSATVNFNIDLPSGGQYRFVGKSNFEGVVSDPKELKFEIGGSGGSNFTLPIVGAAGALVLLGILLFWRRRRRPGRTPATVSRLEPRRERISA